MSKVSKSTKIPTSIRWLRLLMLGAMLGFSLVVLMSHFFGFPNTDFIELIGASSGATLAAVLGKKILIVI